MYKPTDKTHKTGIEVVVNWNCHINNYSSDGELELLYLRFNVSMLYIFYIQKDSNSVYICIFEWNVPQPNSSLRSAQST